MKKIILKLGEHAPENCPWIMAESDGATTTGCGSLAALASEARGYRLLVLLPGAEILLARVALPPGRNKQIRQAIPYALEDLLAGDIEDQHFAVGTREDDGAFPVAVIARARLHYWMGLCLEHGLNPAFMTSEVLAIPFSPGHRTIFLAADGMVLVRDGMQRGFVLERDNLPLLAPEPGANCSPVILYHQEDEPAALPPELANFVTLRRTVPESMPFLALELDEKKTLNLLTGEFQSNSELVTHWQRWQLPLLLLLALLFVSAANIALENSRLSGYREQLQNEIAHEYRKAFPGGKNILNPRSRMEEQLSILRGSESMDGENASGFLELLSRSAPTLTAADRQPLLGLSYHDGIMDLLLEEAGEQDVKNLQEELEKQGLLVVLSRELNETGKGKIRLQIRGGRQ